MSKKPPSHPSTPPETPEQLEHLLSLPSPGSIDSLAQLPGDLLLLGVGGKMGPSLAHMARLASPDPKRRIIGVSRFSAPALEKQLNEWGVTTIRCDLLNRSDIAKLPDAPNVVYMVGRKFGSAGQAPLTWATNAVLPAWVCEKYAHSRLLAFSTGNVYPFVPPESGGCKESDAPNPVGEYGMSALGRERVFEYFSQWHGIPVVLLRLNYACELRYGVLVDIALNVYHNQPVDLGMGYLNTLWQGDANALALQALTLAASPPRLLNLTGLETLSVRSLAKEFGRLLHREPRFKGTESPTALLSNAQSIHQQFGPARVSVPQLCHWIACWICQGGPTLGKPTHFQVRDGQF